MGIKLDGRNIPQIYLGKDKLFDVDEIPERPEPEIVKDNLILHYDFSQGDNNAEDRGVIKDLSGNGNDGTLCNFDYSEESGYVENGLKFDGVDDEIKFDDIVFAADEDFTVEILVKEKDSKNYSGRIFGDGNSFETNTNTYLNYSGNYMFFYRKGMSSSSLGYSNIGLTDVSYSIRSKAKELNFFNRAVKVRSSDNGTITDDESVSVFNNIGQAYAFSDNHFAGVISSVRIYKRGLTDEEIQCNYNIDNEKYFGYIPPPKQYTPIGLKTGEKDISLIMRGDRVVYPNTVQDGLKLWYDFRSMAHDPLKETVVRDLSGNHNHGNLKDFKFDGTDGYMDKGLMFNGEGSEVNFPKITFAADADWTVEIITGNPIIEEDDALYIFGNKVERSSIFFQTSSLYENSMELVYITNAAGSTGYTHSRRRDLPNDFIYGAVTKKDGLVRTEFIGLPTSLVNTRDPVLAEHEQHFDNLGNPYKYSTDYPFKGLIYAVRVYDRALTQEEVTQNHIIDKARYGL